MQIVYRPRTQEERRRATRRALLDAAIDVLLSDGYARCSLAVVAKRAGLTVGALQYHFETRSNLLKAVVEERLSDFEGFGLTKIDNTLPIDQRCARLVELAWRFYGNPKYLALWEIILGARSDPALFADIQTWQQQGVRTFETRLTKTFSDLDLPRSKARSVQYFLNAHLRGLALLATVEKNQRIVTTQKKMLTQTLLHQLLGCEQDTNALNRS